MNHQTRSRYGFSTTIEERFWAKVSITGGDDCWNWNGCKLPSGYGIIGRGTGQVPIGAHVVSWIIHNGSFAPGLSVCHKCDNRSCVNPNHLFLGTQQDNLKDMRSKGRQVKGEKHGLAKLSEDDVRAIRGSNETQARLAAHFGVNQSCISKIQLGKRWK